MPVTTKFALKDLKAREEMIKSTLLDIAVKKGIVKKKEEAVVREVLPATDLGFSNEEWLESITTANAWNLIIDRRLGTKQLLAIYGVRNKATAPLTTAIKFSLGPGGAKTKDILFIEGLEKEKEKEAIFETPILYENDQHMYIEFYGKATGDDRVIFLALLCEPKGEIISS